MEQQEQRMDTVPLEKDEEIDRNGGKHKPNPQAPAKVHYNMEPSAGSFGPENPSG